MDSLSTPTMFHNDGEEMNSTFTIRQDYNENQDYYPLPVFKVSNADADRTFVVDSAALGGCAETWGGIRLGQGGPTFKRYTGAPTADEPAGSMAVAIIEGEGRLYFNVSGGPEGWVAVTG